jgi:hypothetical protein
MSNAPLDAALTRLARQHGEHRFAHRNRLARGVPVEAASSLSSR